MQEEKTLYQLFKESNAVIYRDNGSSDFKMEVLFDKIEIDFYIDDYVKLSQTNNPDSYSYGEIIIPNIHDRTIYNWYLESNGKWSCSILGIGGTFEFVKRRTKNKNREHLDADFTEFDYKD